VMKVDDRNLRLLYLLTFLYCTRSPTRAPSVPSPVGKKEATAEGAQVTRQTSGVCQRSSRVTGELTMGPLCVTRSNPTHQLTDSTQPTTSAESWTQPDPTQCN